MQLFVSRSSRPCQSIESLASALLLRWCPGLNAYVTSRHFFSVAIGGGYMANAALTNSVTTTFYSSFGTANSLSGLAHNLNTTFFTIMNRTSGFIVASVADGVSNLNISDLTTAISPNVSAISNNLFTLQSLIDNFGLLANNISGTTTDISIKSALINSGKRFHDFGFARICSLFCRP